MKEKIVDMIIERIYHEFKVTNGDERAECKADNLKCYIMQSLELYEKEILFNHKNKQNEQVKQH